MSEPSGPLADITIIDCTMALAGPFGAAILADLGANVIKVEPPVGDMARSAASRPSRRTTPMPARQSRQAAISADTSPA